MTVQPTQVDVAIIGGGITGLSLAWFLQQLSASPQPISYALLEQSDRWGGKIRTEMVSGYGDAPFVIEAGPDSFITQKPWGLQLARALGLSQALLPTNDDQRQTFVLNKGRPTPLPDGVLLLVPTKFKPFVFSSLISPWGKLRMGLDLFIPPRRDDGDETLADFVQRRLGGEALDKLAEPLLSGIYNAEADRQSLMATFPRFRAIEQQHGSLIKGMVAARQASASGNTASPNGQKPPSVFTSLQPGMQLLVETLVSQLHGDCRRRAAVSTLRAQPDGGYQLELRDDSNLIAAAVVLAVPAYVAAHLLRPLAPHAANDLDTIRYVSTGTISLAYRRADIQHPLNGFGLVIPRSEARHINAITWTSTKFAQRAPQGYALLRVFFGGSRTPHMMTFADAELVSLVRQELAAMMGIEAEPLFHRIYRWERANPQYDVGHLQRVAQIEAALPPGLFVTGSPYRGVGIPDCVHQAQQTAAALADYLRK